MLLSTLLSALDDQMIKIISIAAAGVGVLILLVLAIVLVATRKKKPKQQNQLQEHPEEEAVPVQPEETPVQEQSVEPEEVEEPAPEVIETSEPEEAVESVPEVAEPNEPEPTEPEQPEEQPVPVEEPQEQPEEEKDEPDEKDEREEKEEDETVRTVTRVNGHVRYIIIKYNKSFTAKIIQSLDEVKNYYSVIKNELLSYKGVKARMSWKGETFYSGRTTYAKLCVRGKCLGLFLALNAKNYEDSKYILDDMSEIATYEKTPCLYRIKNDRRVKYSAELIATVMGEREKLAEPEIIDWAKEYPYEKTDHLVERGLIKVLTEEDAQSGDVFAPRDYVAASEVDELMEDEVATALIEENEEISDRTKCDIINIDTLGRYFDSGETVTLEEIKKRIESVPRRTTYIKVLARGTLDKKLTVIADSFSMEAAKMILLTGGNVVKKKNS